MISRNSGLPARLAFTLLLAGLLNACGGGGGGSSDSTTTTAPIPEPIIPYTSHSSTLWYDSENSALWLLSPDDSRLVKLDGSSLEQLAWFALDQRPIAMSAAAGHLVIALQNGVQRFDLAQESLGPVVALPCGDPHGVVTSIAADKAWVSCINDDLLVEAELGAPASVRLLHAQKPAGLSLVADQLRVTHAAAGAVTTVDLDAFAALPLWGEAHPLPAPALESQYRITTGERHSVSQFNSMSADARTGQVVAAYQLVENQGDRSRAPSEGGYGSIFDGQPRIEPRLVAACGDRYARFDGGIKVFSGPADLALAEGLLWVVHEYTRNVAVLRCPQPTPNAQWPQDTASGELQLIANFAVGSGARGIALAADGRTAWIDNAFDYSVSRLVLTEDMLASGDAFASPQLSRVRDTGDLALSSTARAGRSLFFDATNIHLTPSGIVTCATCHPKAGSDGLDWFLHTTEIPRKFRNTPPAWAARTSSSPFHWAGDFTDAAALTRVTIRGLMEGDALLVDTAAIAAYMNETPAPATAPVPIWQRSRLEQGRELFQSRCSACHSGAAFSDGAKHKVVQDSEDPDGLMALVDTPSLIAVRATAPYLHDGRAAGLQDVILTHNQDDAHGQVSDLRDEDVEALLLYLRSL
ncbi:MAG: c-type cytochrome [Halioglobus sp.]